MLSVVGCALLGVEPDEIDLANGSESEDGAEDTGDGASTNADTYQGEEGDGDPGGDGDGDDAGDGDGDGDTGDGDGDGDGDGIDETSCDELGATPLQLGENDVLIAAGVSLLEGECGHAGPEHVFSYVSEDAADLEFTLTSNFDAALYAVDGAVCLPLVELMCVNTPESLIISVEAQQLIHVIVDSAAPDGGMGTLDVAIVP